MKCVDPELPLSTLVRRWENHRNELVRARNETPRWRWRRRAILSGGIAAYDYEIECLLTLGGKMQPIFVD